MQALFLGDGEVQNAGAPKKPHKIDGNNAIDIMLAVNGPRRLRVTLESINS